MHPTLFWLHFSLSGNSFSWNLWKCDPRLHGKHKSEYSHKTCLIKHITFGTPKRPNLSPFSLRLACLGTFLGPLVFVLTLEKCFKNQHFFNKSAFCRHQAPTYTHHTCHLKLSGSILHFPTTFFHEICENVLPACIGNTILNIATKHFQSKISLFSPRSGPTWAHFGGDVRPYRSAVRAFPLLSAPCPSSWSSKTRANMCISATGGILGRL